MRDYTRFLQMIANGGELLGTRVLKRETVSEMTRNQLKGPAMPIRFPGNVRHGTGFGLGFSVKVADTEWNAGGRVGEYGWGGLLSTHSWISPKDELVVVTMEQTFPYGFLLEDALKPLIYNAIEDE
jgi:CubicO group peptidase (beta-lactamase class C family)